MRRRRRRKRRRGEGIYTKNRNFWRACDFCALLGSVLASLNGRVFLF
jgi:hypothetical protein